MPLVETVLVTVTLLIATLTVSSLILFFARNRMPAVPGPRGYPIVGNLLDVPKDEQWLTFDKWIREYGEITSNPA